MFDATGGMGAGKIDVDARHSCAGHSSWTVTHDYDGDGKSDLNDKDADNDGLDDGWEDWNLNATISSVNETNPYDNDTDDDLLLDGAEPSPFVDSDGDGNINARDTNSNGDSYTDDLQVWVVFRTNATDGSYVGPGKWIALIAPSANPYTPSNYDYSASSALYTYAGELASPPGAAQIQNPNGPPPPTDVVGLETPEGYAVLAALNGSAYDIFIDLPGSTYAKYIKNGSPPSDYTTSNRNVSSFLANKQETYDGRAALNADTDFDGINNTRETSCGLNSSNVDTDGDGISDGKEYRAGCWNTDGTGGPDANDTDSDDDGIPDALEDVNFNGRWDAGETDATFNDTDRDGILDGTEDADHDGIKDASETSPTDKDTDDDGIADKVELDGTWCYIGESVSACAAADHNVRKTGPLDTDSDDDGLLDGQEIGMASAGVDTLVSAFKADSDPSTTTNPNATDTDADGISDRLEDVNLNGRVDSGEPNPTVWDTDGDGLCDGLCSSKGEDKNLNGVRDQDADGNYTETDFLANDSDVDGIVDGQEVNGTWSYKSGIAGCPGDKDPCKLDPLNPDFDGDGLRDGQETAGWMVGIWRESTMEKVTNYTVNSDPTDPTSDADALTDFEEFMNGSDPRALDTDKDGINDTAEIERKSNITGVEGSPPRIENVTLNTEIVTVVGWLYLSITAKVTLTFEVIDNVGIDYVDINMTRYVGSDVRRVAFSTNPSNYTWSSHITEVYEFSIVEVLVAGAYLNITAYDVNGNGAWGDFHIKSVVETVVDLAIAMFLAPIAKVIVEAASAALSWIMESLTAIMDGILAPLDAWIRDAARDARSAVERLVAGMTYLDAFALLRGIAGIFALIEDLVVPATILVLAVTALLTLIMILTAGVGAVLMDTIGELIVSTLKGLVLGAVATVLFGALESLVVDTLPSFESIVEALQNVLGISTTRSADLDVLAILAGTGAIVFGLFLLRKVSVQRAKAQHLEFQAQQRSAVLSASSARDYQTASDIQSGSASAGGLVIAEVLKALFRRAQNADGDDITARQAGREAKSQAFFLQAALRFLSYSIALSLVSALLSAASITAESEEEGTATAAAAWVAGTGALLYAMEAHSLIKAAGPLGTVIKKLDLASTAFAGVTFVVATGAMIL